MRRILIYTVFLASLFLFMGCKKDPVNRFDMIYPELYFTIPAGLDPFRIHFIEIRDIPFNKQFYFNQQGVSNPEAVVIQPKSARISSIFGDFDYDFIDRISILIADAERPDHYFEVYFRDPLPLRVGPFLDLIPTLLDIHQIVKSDRFNLRLRIQLRATTPAFIESRLDYIFSGDASGQ